MLSLCFCFLVAKKSNSESAPQQSKVIVVKNGVQWTETRATGTLNTNNHMVAISITQDTETFTFIFPKPIDTDVQKKFEAYSLIVPAIGMASISDSYHLDTSKSNSLTILAFDYITNRLVGKFQLNLKQDDSYVDGTAKSSVFEGEFDMKFDEQAL
ncbi:hypothetical protein [Sphingobacterium hungaricum]